MGAGYNRPLSEMRFRVLDKRMHSPAGERLLRPAGAAKKFRPCGIVRKACKSCRRPTANLGRVCAKCLDNPLPLAQEPVNDDNADSQ